MPFINFLTLIITLAAAINWGLWGFAGYDFIADMFGGNMNIWARLCYAFAGLCGVYSLRLLFNKAVYVKKCVCHHEGEHEFYEEVNEEDENKEE